MDTEMGLLNPHGRKVVFIIWKISVSTLLESSSGVTEEDSVTPEED